MVSWCPFAMVVALMVLGEPSKVWANEIYPEASVDYFEYVATQGDDLLFLESSAKIPIGSFAAASKVSVEKPLGQDFSGGEIELKAEMRTSSSLNIFIGGRQGLVGGKENTALLTGLSAEIVHGYSLTIEILVSEKARGYGKIEISGETRRGAVWAEPKAEFYWSAQNVPEAEIGAGADALELSLRVGIIARSGIRPYIGVLYSTPLATSRAFAGQLNGDIETVSTVVGIRFKM